MKPQPTRLCVVFCISPLDDMNTVLLKIKCSKINSRQIVCVRFINTEQKNKTNKQTGKDFQLTFYI